MANSFTQQVRQAVLGNAETVLQGFERVGEDRTTRLVRSTTPTVIYYTPTDDVPIDLTPPGTVTAFVAPTGASFLADVADAYTRADADRIAALAQTFTDTLSTLTAPLSTQFAAGDPAIESAADALVDSEVLADLQYRGKVLAQSIGLVFDLPFFKLSLPYNGGPLTDTDFSLVEYHKRDAQSSLEAIVVVRRPVLTQAEEEALELVPAEFRELNVGFEMGILPTIATTVLLTTAATTMWTVTLGSTREASFVLRNEMSDVPTHLEEEIRHLGPMPTAQALLAVRQRAFMQI